MKHKMLTEALKSVEKSVRRDINLYFYLQNHAGESCAGDDFKDAMVHLVRARMHNFLKDFNQQTALLLEDHIKRVVTIQTQKGIHKAVPELTLARLEVARMAQEATMHLEVIRKLEKQLEDTGAGSGNPHGVGTEEG